MPRARDEHRSGLKALALLNAKALQQGLALETVQRTWRCSEGYYMLLLHITNSTIKVGCDRLSSGSVPGVEGFMVEYHFYTDDQQNVRG